MARRGSQQKLMDNQLIVSPQSEHGLGSERQESTQTQSWFWIVFGLVQSLCFQLCHNTLKCLTKTEILLQSLVATVYPTVLEKKTGRMNTIRTE